MSIEGHIIQMSNEHLEATQAAIRDLGKRMAQAMLDFAAVLEEANRATESQIIVREDLPPIIDRRLGDVLAWLREAGHDI